MKYAVSCLFAVCGVRTLVYAHVFCMLVCGCVGVWVCGCVGVWYDRCVSFAN